MEITFLIGVWGQSISRFDSPYTFTNHPHDPQHFEPTTVCITQHLKS